MKHLFSDKSISGDKINLSEDSKHVKTQMKAADVLNNFFSNIIKNLKNPQYSNIDPIIQSMEDPISKIIPKYKDHPSIFTIQTKARINFPLVWTCLAHKTLKKNMIDFKN